MQLSLSSYTCKIKVIPLLLFIALMALLFRLGFWQLNRAEEKRMIIQEQQSKMQLPEVPLFELMAKTSDLIYRRVQLIGHYDVEHQVLVDNQIHQGQVGYFVITPFVLAGSHQTVLVNRGWVKMPKDRYQLPDIKILATRKDIIVVGVINHFPSVGLILKGADVPSKGWPSIVQIIDAQKMSEKLQRTILDFQVQLVEDQANGYIREWQVVSRMPPEKHIAYAFQWFALAVTLFLLMLWISCKKQIKHDESTE